MKFYSGDCYIVQYTYAGLEREENLFYAWLGCRSALVSVVYVLLGISDPILFRNTSPQSNDEVIQVYPSFHTLFNRKDLSLVTLAMRKWKQE